MGFWEGGSLKVFRWEGQSEQLGDIRLEFINRESGATYFWPGDLGSEPGTIGSDAHQASFDVMALYKAGGES